MKQMLTKIIFLITLCLFWFLIAGQEGIMHYPILSLLSLVSAFLISLYYNLIPQKYYNPFRLIAYIFWLIREIVISSWYVTKIIWNPRAKIQPRIMELETDFSPSSSEIVFLANSITLTPGTYTIDIKSNKLIVHSLTTANLRDLKSGSMQKKLKKCCSKSNL